MAKQDTNFIGMSTKNPTTNIAVFDKNIFIFQPGRVSLSPKHLAGYSAPSTVKIKKWLF